LHVTPAELKFVDVVECSWHSRVICATNLPDTVSVSRSSRWHAKSPTAQLDGHLADDASQISEFLTGEVKKNLRRSFGELTYVSAS